MVLRYWQRFGKSTGRATSRYVNLPTPDHDSVQHRERGHRTSTSHPVRRPARRSSPVILSTWILIPILGLLCACALAVGILYYYTQRQYGLAIIPSSHHTWVYGPTAVLVLLVGIWRQVDYHTKVLTPWRELQAGPVPASRSILLDYLSPVLPLAIYRAITFRHFGVVATMVGFVVLKVTTVVSSGLLYSVDVHVTPHSIELYKTTQFRSFAPPADASATFSATADPALLYNANAILNLAYPRPDGVGVDVLYETVRPQEVSDWSSAHWEATVPGFYPVMNCEPVDVFVDISKSAFDRSGRAPIFPVKLKTDSCPYGYLESYANKTSGIIACPADAVACPNFQIRQLATLVRNCTGDSDADRSRPHEVLFALARLNYTQTWNQSMPTPQPGIILAPTTWDFAVSQTVASLCKISYMLAPTQLRYDVSGLQRRIEAVKIDDDQSSVILAGVSNFDIRAAYYAVLQSGRAMLDSSTDLLAEYPSGTLFGLIEQHARTRYDGYLANSTLLATQAEAVFQAIGVQIGKGYLVQSGSDIVKGTLEYWEGRLFMQPIFAWVVFGSFLVAIVTAVLIIMLRPNGVTAQSSISMAFIAQSVRQSPLFRRVLSKISGSTEHHAKQALSASHYSSEVVDGITVIIPGGSSRVVGAVDHKTMRRPSWWAPLSLSWPFLLLTALSALVAIVELEILQRLSDQSQGIFRVQSSIDSRVEMGARAIAALLAACIAALYNSLDFNALLLAPYSALKAGGKRSRALETNLLGQMSLTALFTAFRHRHWAAMLTSLATLTGSGLTIAAAGLYSIESVPMPSAVSLDRLDVWATNFTNSFATDNSSAIASSLIESAKSAYPDFTYDQLALPSFAAHAWSDGAIVQSGSLEIQVPALRGKLACERVDATAYTRTCRSADQSTGDMECFLDARIPLPPACHRGSAYGNESWSQLSVRLGADDQIYGGIQSIHVGPYKVSGDLTDWGEHADTVDEQPDNPPSCPTLAIYHGRTQESAGNDIGYIQFLVCKQQLEMVQTKVTFTVPGLQISLSAPPTADESTASLLRSPIDSNESGFPWRIQRHLANSLSLINSVTPGTTAARTTAGSVYDAFFTGVLFGRTPLLELSVGGQANAGVVFDHIQQYYRRYMAQFISANLRSYSSLSVSDQPESIPGIFTPATTTSVRLVQHKLPKRVLEVMLALMFVCGVLAYTIGHFHRLVPWNPCTIVGRSLLVVDSKMCNPPGQESIGDDKDGEKLMVQQEYLGRKSDATSVTSRDAPRIELNYVGTPIDFSVHDVHRESINSVSTWNGRWRRGRDSDFSYSEAYVPRHDNDDDDDEQEHRGRTRRKGDYHALEGSGHVRSESDAYGGEFGDGTRLLPLRPGSVHTYVPPESRSSSMKLPMMAGSESPSPEQSASTTGKATVHSAVAVGQKPGTPNAATVMSISRVRARSLSVGTRKQQAARSAQNRIDGKMGVVIDVESRQRQQKYKNGSKSVLRPSAVYRLGWWRDGIFVGARQPRSLADSVRVDVGGGGGGGHVVEDMVDGHKGGSDTKQHDQPTVETAMLSTGGHGANRVTKESIWYGIDQV